MKISVVIPVYNEITTIAAIIERVKRVPLDKEIIVVDDCSTDGTREELQRLSGSDAALIVVFRDRNQGKGASVAEGLRRVSGDVVIIQDADLEYYPEEYPRLIDPILKGKADVVYGSRFLGTHRVFTLSHYLGNKILNLVANLLYNSVFTDMETCYKAFRADIIPHFSLRSRSFGFEPEFTANVVKRGYRVYEVPISYDGRSYTEGKKITWRDGIIALYWLLRCRFQKMDVPREALLRIETVGRYNDWIFEKLSPWLGERVLEVGAGVGAITRELVRTPYLIASEWSADYLGALRTRIVESDRLRVVRFDPSADRGERFAGDRLDTVLCANILEHIGDDAAALRCFHEALIPGGRCVILVPACRRLFSPMDAALGHHRRYSKSELSRKMREAGFKIESLRFFNLPGAIGWWLNGKILRRRMLPMVQMRLFNLLVPLLRIEDQVRLPFGLSLLAVGKKE